MRSTFAIAVALILAVLPVNAHVTIPTEFKQVVGESPLIVRGRVTDVRSVAVPDVGIESIATVAVESVLKGQSAGFVYVRYPGGVVGRSKIVMIGAPTFQPGQRAVFFLKPSGTDSSYRPFGLTLGIYRVQPDPQSGRPVIQPPLVGGRTSPLLGRTVRGDVRRRLMPVAEFESLVRSVVGSKPGTAVIRRRGGE